VAKLVPTWEITHTHGITMVRVPAGPFEMGSTVSIEA